MGEFSVDWLTLREPADRRSRSVSLVGDLRRHLRGGAAAESLPVPLRILDLGAGTGSNVRALAPHLPMPQQWCLVDRDADLLRDLPKRVAAWALDRGAVVNGTGAGFAVRGPSCELHIAVQEADLVPLVNALPSASQSAPLLEGRDLVTASALLDLVSAPWLDRLVARCAAMGAAVLFVLTYDGRLRCSPPDDDDELIRELVNRHQQTAKGFGVALGPAATAATQQRFAAAGYDVIVAASDWELTPADGALQRSLLEGWAQAACEMAPREDGRIAGWLQRRLEHLGAGTSTLIVGHQDLAGWPRR